MVLALHMSGNVFNSLAQGNGIASLYKFGNANLRARAGNVWPEGVQVDTN